MKPIKIIITSYTKNKVDHSDFYFKARSLGPTVFTLYDNPLYVSVGTISPQITPIEFIKIDFEIK